MPLWAINQKFLISYNGFFWLIVVYVFLFLGKVKIPVNTVNSRYLIEKWYQVTPDPPANNSNQNSKEKDCPSLRIKCKFQSIDVLPLRCYKPFLQVCNLTHLLNNEKF